MLKGFASKPRGQEEQLRVAPGVPHASAGARPIPLYDAPTGR